MKESAIQVARIELPWPPRDLSPNSRVHWSVRAKAAKNYRETCWALTMASNVKPGSARPIMLKVTFLAPDRRRRDDDNIIAAWKAGRDGLADAWGVDDRHFSVAYFCGAEPVKGGMVIVEIKEEDI